MPMALDAMRTTQAQPSEQTNNKQTTHRALISFRLFVCL
jgi:hypothetical protein